MFNKTLDSALKELKRKIEKIKSQDGKDYFKKIYIHVTKKAKFEKSATKLFIC